MKFVIQAMTSRMVDLAVAQATLLKYCGRKALSWELVRENRRRMECSASMLWADMKLLAT